jgi:uncharacterized protein YjbI with pentapeptide repeats
MKTDRLSVVGEQFDAADLSGFNFLYLQFENCSFVGATFTPHAIVCALNCNFSKAVLNGVNFADATGSNFCN